MEIKNDIQTNSLIGNLVSKYFPIASCFLIIIFTSFSYFLWAQPIDSNAFGNSLAGIKKKMFAGSINAELLTEMDLTDIFQFVEENKYKDFPDGTLDSLIALSLKSSEYLNFMPGMAKSMFWRAWLQIPKNRSGIPGHYSITDAQISNELFEELEDDYWLAKSYDLLASLAIYQDQYDTAKVYLTAAEKTLLNLDTTSIAYQGLRGLIANTKGAWWMNNPNVPDTLSEQKAKQFSCKVFKA